MLGISIAAVRHRRLRVESYDCPITVGSAPINSAGTGDHERPAHAARYATLMDGLGKALRKKCMFNRAEFLQKYVFVSKNIVMSA